MPERRSDVILGSTVQTSMTKRFLFRTRENKFLKKRWKKKEKQSSNYFLLTRVVWLWKSIVSSCVFRAWWSLQRFVKKVTWKRGRGWQISLNYKMEMVPCCEISDLESFDAFSPQGCLKFDKTASNFSDFSNKGSCVWLQKLCEASNNGRDDNVRTDGGGLKEARVSSGSTGFWTCCAPNARLVCIWMWMDVLCGYGFIFPKKAFR